MKENIKKLTVFVMIVAMAMFIAVAIASAKVSKRNTISGEYAMMASGTCLNAPGGFISDHTIPTGPSWAVFNMAKGIWTFHHDGTGTVQGTQFALTPPPFGPPFGNPNAAELKFSYDFTYTVTGGGAITVDMLVDTYSAEFVKGPLKDGTHSYDPSATVRMFGMVSVDHKTITLANENDYQVSIIQPPSGPTLSVPSVCNIARVLIRLGEIERCKGRD